MAVEWYLRILSEYVVPHYGKYSVVGSFMHNDAPPQVANLMKTFHFGYYLRISSIYYAVRSSGPTTFSLDSGIFSAVELFKNTCVPVISFHWQKEDAL